MAKAKQIKNPGKNDPSWSSKYSRLKRVLINRFTKSFLAILLILAALPVAFTLIYTIPGTTPGSTLMLARVFTLQSMDRRWIALDDIAQVVPQSVIMSEDGQFCSHRGVDWNELTAVIDDALDGEKTRGASTLSMQTVKNLFFWPQRSFVRKVIEIPYAMLADLIWSKRRMMEIYLNIAEWDEGIFGIEAASQHYFKRSASKLSRRQAALLTVTLPNPKNRNPAKPTRNLTKLARVIEKRATQSGAYIKCLEK